MTLGTARVIRGNALALPLQDESVDLIVTSPPYWSLRQYTDGGAAYRGQIGGEDTPGEFIDNLVAATAEMVRVLKLTGSAFVNLGDKYGPDKSLMDLPHRYAIRAVDELGLIKRAEICWAKPNGLPESVTDRVRRSHEMFFHFVKQPRYYSAVDEIREEAQQERPQARRARALAAQHGLTDAHRDALLARGLGDTGRSAAVQSGTGKNTAEVNRLAAEADRALGGYAREFTMTSQALGKLPGSVWEIPTQPLTVPPHLGVDHYAAFPIEWPRRIIAGWSPSGICTACGQGRRPVSGIDCEVCDGFRPANSPSCPECGHTREWKNGRKVAPIKGQTDFTSSGAAVPMKPRSEMASTKQYANGYACACPDTTAPTTPAVILDPFGGTGTTALAAKAAGRTGITIDMSADYCRLATWRTNDPGQLAAALQVDKPAPVAPDQLDLLEGLLA